MLGFLASLGPVLAQEIDRPPETLPAGASLSGSSLSLPGQSFAFSSTALSFSASPVSVPAGTLSAPASAVSAPAASTAMSVKEEKGGLRFTLNADLLFDFDKADLRPQADAVLRDLVAQVQARLPAGRYRIEGHTDAKGNDRYNDALSNRRARSVQAWLTRNAGVPANRTATAGFGRSRPAAPNQKPDGSDDPEGRQKNRRVEILVRP